MNKIQKYIVYIIILLCSCIGTISAQKAYDIVIYQGSYNGRSFQLEYADGYPEASKVVLMAANGQRQRVLSENQILQPSGELRCDYEGGYFLIDLSSVVSEGGRPDAFQCCYVKQGNKQDAFAVTKSDYATADFYLNQTYSEIRRRYKAAPKFLEALRLAQRLWIKYRDAEVEMRFPLEDKHLEYGSSYVFCRETFLAKMTRQRTDELKQWLEDPEEGDVCHGSVGRIKE